MSVRTKGRKEVRGRMHGGCLKKKGGGSGVQIVLYRELFVVSGDRE
ncbi:MAG: hypothetical protein JSV56_07975 [Methanomassiliicoccales archaeon]|nr:MAG: hypothetical protein JSV56_07975 [Methanomassiliicoccales archaeon]